MYLYNLYVLDYCSQRGAKENEYMYIDIVIQTFYRADMRGKEAVELSLGSSRPEPPPAHQTKAGARGPVV